ncbi:SusC/RagA family TonB-linked outer membrane protein [Sphingobacterium shayense]|uniref:SusC/RagA family TonB-linked outer membrane protein n=1 Tax=Sphingobacterium shayense TaxID=626343 RepID=UPI0015516DAB|nr:SusC/RagA family TonB-linked outer membrane protein [Sphingobacterium shayense]NQD72099.1 SusC/RagA family TonB-linked outer membrane protein [Sphingobacterium shayense]
MRFISFILVIGLSVLLGKAQERMNPLIQGTILADETEKPLAEVTIYAIKGKIGTSSDRNGIFEIKVLDPADSLRISSVGYTTVVLPSSYFSDSRALLLKRSDNLIDEVIIETGYQQVKPNESTGAVEVIDNKMLNAQPGTNILQRLKNMASSVRFDNQPIQNGDLQKLNISVRGMSTIDGNLDPLVVLDGFIYEGRIENIDPNGIESITILKDAAASSIWGARAGNGVIVMTSKKGAISETQATKISFSNTLLMRKRTDLNELYQLDNHDFIAVEEMLFNSGYYDNQLSRTPYIAVTPAIEIFRKRKEGLITMKDSAAMIEQLMGYDGRKQYMENFLSTPLVNQLSLGLTGGTKINSFGMVLGYTTNRSETSDKDRKLNIQLSNSFRPTKNLQLDFLVRYTNNRQRSGKPGYSSLTYSGRAVPYMSFFDQNGKQLPLDLSYRSSYMDATYNEGYLDWSYYPLTDYLHSGTNRNLNEWFSTVRAGYKIASFLEANVSFQYQNQQQETVNMNDQESYYSRMYINQFTQYDPTTGVPVHIVPLGGIRNATESKGSSYTVRGQLNFNKTFSHHTVIGILGTEARENIVKGSNLTAYGYSDNPLTAVAVDYAQSYQIAPTKASRTIAGTPSYSLLTNRFVSLYTNWSYIYRNRYGLSGSFRRDGANIFGAATNDQWSPLWSVGTFWELGKESFLDIDWIDQLKMRVTYGYSGNVDLRKTPQPVGSTGGSIYTNYPGLVIAMLNDPSLRWEKIGTTNFGLDFSFLKNRINGSIDYFVKSGKDLYGKSEYDYTTWGRNGTVTKNVAAMRTTGMDIVINTRNVDKAIKWNSRIVLNFNKNKTVAYYNSLNTGIVSFLGNGTTIQPIVGKPLYGLAGYRWMGLDNEGNPQGSLYGQPSTAYSDIQNQSYLDSEASGSIVYFGSAKPQIFGSLMNTITYRAFSFAFNISYQGDYYFNRPVTSYNSLFRNGGAFPDFERRWQKVGDESKTNVPGMRYPISSGRDAFYRNAEINVLRADHLRLEFLSLRWERTYKLADRKYNLRIEGSANNLGLLWTANKEGIDPEFPYKIAPARVYSLGVQLDF